MAHCTACESARTGPDPFYYAWKGRRFDVYRCFDCTHQFVFPQVTESDQAEIYSDAYFGASGDWSCGTLRGGYAEAASQLVSESRAILAALPENSGRLLDIGCAGGTFLLEARAVGFTVTGLELNSAQAAAARNRGLEVLNERIEDAPSRWGPFDIVTLLDCLEHVPAPLKALRKVAGWLVPGGAVFIRGPLANCRLGRLKEAVRRITGPTKRLPGYPLDANAFSPRSLEALLMKAGFDKAIWATETKGFGQVWARRL
jgi:SAM-dependent methyltransferase